MESVLLAFEEAGFGRGGVLAMLLGASDEGCSCQEERELSSEARELGDDSCNL